MNILAKLGTSFDSNNFLDAFQDTYPFQYGEALLFARTYRNLHCWTARWYLSRCSYVRNLGRDNKVRESRNGNLTRNHRWAK